MDCSLPDSCPWNFLGKNTGVGCHFLLQDIASRSLKYKSLPALWPGPFPLWHYPHDLLLLELAWFCTSMKELTIDWTVGKASLVHESYHISFFSSTQYVPFFLRLTNPDGIVGPTFPLSWDPSWLKLAQGLASLHSYVTSVESSIPLLAYLPVNIFEANLELTLSMIISNKNIHKVLVTKQSSILCLICITMWQNIL